jgi:hypothetical protein
MAGALPEKQVGESHRGDRHHRLSGHVLSKSSARSGKRSSPGTEPPCSGKDAGMAVRFKFQNGICGAEEGEVPEGEGPMPWSFVRGGRGRGRRGQRHLDVSVRYRYHPSTIVPLGAYRRRCQLPLLRDHGANLELALDGRR